MYRKWLKAYRGQKICINKRYIRLFGDSRVESLIGKIQELNLGALNRSVVSGMNGSTCSLTRNRPLTMSYV